MSDVIDYNIFSDVMQPVEIESDPSKDVRTEIGVEVNKENGIGMQTCAG